MDDPKLQLLVERANEDEHFVGHRLAQYRQLHELNETELAERLRCGHEGLTRLALCRAPKPTDDFVQQVQQIAQFAQCDATQLAMLLRFTDAVRIAPCVSTETGQNLSLAARDSKGHQKASDAGNFGD